MPTSKRLICVKNLIISRTLFSVCWLYRNFKLHLHFTSGFADTKCVREIIKLFVLTTASQCNWLRTPWRRNCAIRIVYAIHRHRKFIKMYCSYR